MHLIWLDNRNRSAPLLVVDSIARRFEIAAEFATGVLREWLGTRFEALQREPSVVDAGALVPGA